MSCCCGSSCPNGFMEEGIETALEMKRALDVAVTGQCVYCRASSSSSYKKREREREGTETSSGGKRAGDEVIRHVPMLHRENFMTAPPPECAYIHCVCRLNLVVDDVRERERERRPLSLSLSLFPLWRKERQHPTLSFPPTDPGVSSGDRSSTLGRSSTLSLWRFRISLSLSLFLLPLRLLPFLSLSLNLMTSQFRALTSVCVATYSVGTFGKKKPQSHYPLSRKRHSRHENVIVAIVLWIINDSPSSPDSLRVFFFPPSLLWWCSDLFVNVYSSLRQNENYSRVSLGYLQLHHDHQS